MTSPIDCLTPYEATALLTEALNHIDLVEPAVIREPVAQVLGKALSIAHQAPTLWGQPVRYALLIAHGLVREFHQQQTGGR